MFRDIVLREILDHLLSLRLALTFGLTVAVMGMGGYLSVADYAQLTADYRESVDRNLRQLKGWTARPDWYSIYTAFSHNEQSIYRAPNPLTFVAEGHEKDLPDVFVIDAFDFDGPGLSLRTNFTLWKFEGIDWTFVVGIILSFAALILTYDGISGERSTETLRLMMSNSVSRGTIILAKYAGAMVSLTLPLVAGILINLLIVGTSGAVPLTGADWGRVVVVFVLAELYLSAFAMLGLFFSSRFRESSASLVVSLLAWTVLVVIVPNSGGILASGLVEVPGPGQISDRASHARQEARRSYKARYPDADDTFSGNWSPGEILARAFDVADAHVREYDEYRDSMIKQVQVARSLTRISPASVFQYASEGVVGSGLPHYVRFLDQARRYRMALRDCLVEYYLFDRYHPFVWSSRENQEKMKKIQVDFDRIPKFEDRSVRAVETLREASWDILLLFLFGAVFFLAAYVSFLRCDVR